MKKIICIAFAAVMAVSLTACGENSSKNSGLGSPVTDSPTEGIQQTVANGADETTEAAGNTDKKEYQAENKIYEVAEAGSEDAPAISTLTFTYDGKTLTYPFTLSDMENIGITFYDHIKDRTVSRNGIVGNIDGLTASGGGKINLAVKNTSSDPLNVMDCTVTYISTENPNVAINSVQPGTTTYEEVLELFGRDKEERKNTLYNENIRNEDELNPDRQLDYSAKFKEEGAVGKTRADLTIMMDVDTESRQILDSVYSVTYSSK